MDEPELRALQTLTLLVAVCEQTSVDVKAAGGFEGPLLRRIDELRDLAVDVVRSRHAASKRA